MYSAEIQEFAGMLVIGVGLWAAVFIGICLGRAIRLARMESMNGDSQDTRSEPPTRPTIRPIPPGPIWQNSRIWEDLHEQRQHVDPGPRRILGSFPEVTGSPIPFESAEDEQIFRFESGHRREVHEDSRDWR
jgi:hypothetical protein